MNLVFKIRRKTDGLYSMGGFNPRFSKIGKIWKQRGHLTNHLNQIDDRPIRNGKHVYSDCEIVLIELTERQAGNITLQQWMDDVQQRKNEREQARIIRMEDHEKQRRKQLYEELKKEFEQ